MTPNRLQRSLLQLSRIPAFLRPWLQDRLIGRAVPFTGTAGIHFELMSPERVVLTLANRRPVQNHIRQVHACATALLGETATGMVLGMNIPDHRLPLLKSQSIEYVRRSEGALRAVATLPAGTLELMQADDKGEVEIPVRITDATGTEIVLCRYVWAWITKAPKP